MADSRELGWQALLEGFPWFRGEGNYPLPAYSERMAAPRLGRSPYGGMLEDCSAVSDPYGWTITEAEEELEIRPGLTHLAERLLSLLMKFGKGDPAPAIGGHQNKNLMGNPCWPPKLADCAGRLPHERFVFMLPLSLSRTQDDLARVRWTFFGGSEQGPERAFWKSFFTAPNAERPEKECLAVLYRILSEAHGLEVKSPKDLFTIGFRILPSDPASPHPSGKVEPLPHWTEPFLVSDSTDWQLVRHLLTFRPFERLPVLVQERYLAGKLHLLPFPGSLVFWDMPTYRALATQLPMAMQIPLLQLVPRHGGPPGLRIPQSGWLHEPRPDLDLTTIQEELLVPTYQRTHRWSRVHRYEDELALNPRVDRLAHVLFGTSLKDLGLYDKPLALNVHLWTQDFRLLLDGPHADREDLRRAEAALIEGGLFGYRFQFPAMRVGRHEVYWHRPLVACLSRRTGRIEPIADSPTGYLTAYDADSPDLGDPIELWPRLLRREPFLQALEDFGRHDHYSGQTTHNLLSLLEAWQLMGEKPLPRTFSRQLIIAPKQDSLEDWIESLPSRATSPGLGQKMQAHLADRLSPSAEDLPEPLTYSQTATRAFEEAYWHDIELLSNGRYRNMDNADTVLDAVTQSKLTHPHRDLEKLGDYLLERHRQAIDAAGMKGRADCGELPFHWETSFDFKDFGGWKANQPDRPHERDLLVVIPGRNRAQAVVFADHYDTAYMEDIFDPSRGGSGARLAAPGADDNHSATATLLQAAPIYLRLAREGRLERDVWLLHLTGEEFPADSLGARFFCRALIEGRLELLLRGGARKDLSCVQVVGLAQMDMIAHNRESAQDIFQISPGRGRESLLLAQEAHTANMVWNARTHQWNQAPERKGAGRGLRNPRAVGLPPVTRHPLLYGEVRTADSPLSSLYNTDGQIFSDAGIPVILFMEDYDIDRVGYHDSHDTMDNIDLDYGSALAAIAIETIARLATR